MARRMTALMMSAADVRPAFLKPRVKGEAWASVESESRAGSVEGTKRPMMKMAPV